MKWNELTLWQYQQLMPTITNPNKDWTELDAEVKQLCIVTGLTEYQIDSLSLTALKELRKELAFLSEPIDGKPINYIVTNGKRYRINYDIKNMPSARYIESKVFSKDTLANLHKIAASMVIPQKRNWFGKWVDQDYDASKHEEYAADMQEANFVHIYHSLVFFYQVYKNWIEVSRDYMMAEITKAGMTKKQAAMVVDLLSASMDGIIPVTLLPPKKISELKKYLK
jgi:hypothetical protein